jgi:predicted N-acetyltransferase YhbS
MQKTNLLNNVEVRFATESDVPAIRVLVNKSYKELADMGLNYTATYQDEKVTLERMSAGKTLVIELDGKIVGTIILKKHNEFTNKNSAYLSQLAIEPSLKKMRLGTMLMDLCEKAALELGYECVQLDTAKPAQHLVDWYLKRGYQIVGETKWEGKTYESFVFEKALL